MRIVIAGGSAAGLFAALLLARAEHYFDFVVADLPRHQLMDVNVVPIVRGMPGLLMHPPQRLLALRPANPPILRG